jgi:hypothetical protein
MNTIEWLCVRVMVVFFAANATRKEHVLKYFIRNTSCPNTKIDSLHSGPVSISRYVFDDLILAP